MQAADRIWAIRRQRLPQPSSHISRTELEDHSWSMTTIGAMAYATAARTVDYFVSHSGVSHGNKKITKFVN
jgi:hypothetical protein